MTLNQTVKYKHPKCVCVHRAYHFGLKGRLYLPVLEAFPVDTSEEGMFSDVPFSLRATAKTLGWVLGHQLLIVRNKKEDINHGDF